MLSLLISVIRVVIVAKVWYNILMVNKLNIGSKASKSEQSKLKQGKLNLLVLLIAKQAYKQSKLKQYKQQARQAYLEAKQATGGGGVGKHPDWAFPKFRTVLDLDGKSLLVKIGF